MTVNLTCAQVSALLPFYIENKLSSHLQQFVASHLEHCPKCMVKYERLKKLMLNLKDEHEFKSAEEQEASSELSDELMMSLSAYVDNELDEIESIKVKKNIISNPKARKEFENLYALKNIMYRDFEREKSDIKSDFSKAIFRKANLRDEVYCEDAFFKVFIILLACSSSLLLLTFFFVFR